MPAAQTRTAYAGHQSIYRAEILPASDEVLEYYSIQHDSRPAEVVPWNVDREPGGIIPQNILETMGSKNQSRELGRTITRQRMHVILKHDTVPNISDFGRQRYSRANPPLGDHVHPDTMEICYLDGGEQVFVVGGKQFHLTGGDVFVTYPDERHSSGALPMEKSTLYWLGINLRESTRGFLGYSEREAETLRMRLARIGPRHFKGGPHLRDLLEKAIAAYSEKDALGIIMFRNHLTEFLLAVCRCSRQKHPHQHSTLIDDLLVYIAKHLHEKLAVSDLASQVQLSIARFKQRFKDEMGIAPNEYVLRSKIEAAKRALADGTTSVTAVAIDLHFSSSQYFATVFRRYTGTTPMAFVRNSTPRTRRR